jgi:hypothetical protein
MNACPLCAIVSRKLPTSAGPWIGITGTKTALVFVGLSKAMMNGDWRVAIAIDFVQASRRLRPSVDKRRNEITGPFKANARLALVEIDSKVRRWEELIRSLDWSGHDVRTLDAQLSDLKYLLEIARAKVDSL